MLNPVLKTTRVICAGSQLQRVQQVICGQPVSLGSFSAMQHAVDPELLAGLLRSLAGEALPRFGNGKDRERRSAKSCRGWDAIAALPRMTWAIWQNPQNRTGNPEERARAQRHAFACNHAHDPVRGHPVQELQEQGLPR